MLTHEREIVCTHMQASFKGRKKKKRRQTVIELLLAAIKCVFCLGFLLPSLSFGAGSLNHNAPTAFVFSRPFFFEAPQKDTGACAIIINEALWGSKR